MISLISDFNLLSRRSVKADADAQNLPPGAWVSIVEVNGVETASPMHSGISSSYGAQIFVSGDVGGITPDVKELDKVPIIDDSCRAVTDQFYTTDGHTPQPGEGLYVSQDASNLGKVLCKVANDAGDVVGVVLRTHTNYEHKGVVYPQVIEYVMDPEIITIEQAEARAAAAAAAAAVASYGYAAGLGVMLDASTDDYGVIDVSTATKCQVISTSNFTIEIWVRVRTSSFDKYILARNGGGSNRHFRVRAWNSSVIGFTENFGDQDDKGWMQYVFSHTGSTNVTRCFRNGVYTDDGSMGVYSENGADIEIGADGSSSGLLTGDSMIGEMRWWDATLSDAAVAALTVSATTNLGKQPSQQEVYPINPSSDSGDYTNSSDLFGHWRFGDGTENGSGTTIYNMASGYSTGYNITWQSAPTYADVGPHSPEPSGTNVASKSLALDGVDEWGHVDSTSAPLMQEDGSSDFSVQTWFKYADDNDGHIVNAAHYNDPILSIRLTSSELEIYVGGGDSGNKLSYDGGSNRVARSSHSDEWPFEDGKWVHVVVTYRASDGLASAYVNGHLLGWTTIGSWNPSLSSGSEQYGITFGDAYSKYYDGSSWVSGLDAASRHIEGEIAHFAYWSSLLTGKEIYSLYNNLTGPVDLSGKSGAYTSSSSLAAWYKFDQTTGTAVTDDSSNSNNVTLVNTADSNWKTFSST